MKQLLLLVFTVVFGCPSFCQSYLLDGDRCFDNGNYPCAETKYREAFKLAIGTDKQIAEIKLARTIRCAEQLKEANLAFSNKNFQSAIEIYESVLDSNPNDPTAKSQIKKCKEILFVPTTLPSRVSGPLERCSGENRLETYSLIGAILGTDTKYWLLFEDGKEVRRFIRDTLKLSPSRSTKYRVCPENDLSKFVEFEIVVHNVPTITGIITGSDEVCAGEQFTLSVDENYANKNFILNWYKAEPTSSSRKLIGTGIQITNVVQANALYEVQASYKGCLGASKLVKTVSVVPIPTQPIIEGHVFKGGSSQKAVISLSAQSEENIQYEWSTDAFSTKATSTKTLITPSLRNGANTISVRALNRCGVSSSTTVYDITRPRTGYFFMNFGAAITDVQTMNTLMVTLGFKNIYFRFKANPSQLGSNGLPSTQFAGRELEITNSGRVTNFPPATGQYYVVNEEVKSNRQAATVGTSFGGRRLRLYVGGGYGERTILWGYNLYSYNGNFNSRNGWAKNINQSWKGLEGEGGLFLKLGHFNVMAGASAIFDSKQDAPFIDFHLGIGFSTR